MDLYFFNVKITRSQYKIGKRIITKNNDKLKMRTNYLGCLWDMLVVEEVKLPYKS